MIYYDKNGRILLNPLAKFPKLSSYEDVCMLLDPMMEEIVTLSEEIKNFPERDLDEIESLYEQIKNIMTRLLVETELGNTHNIYIQGLMDFALQLRNYAIECHDEHAIRQHNRKAIEKDQKEKDEAIKKVPSWLHASLNIPGFSNFVKQEHVSINNTKEDDIDENKPSSKLQEVHGGDDDGDDSSSSSSSSSSSNSSSSDDSNDKNKKDKNLNDYLKLLSTGKATSPSNNNKSKKKKSTKETKKKESKHKKEDKRYRDIVKVLSKNSSNFHLKPFTMNSDPQIKRESFRLWIIELSNVLSTHWRTNDILRDYPAKVTKIKCKGTDRAVKAILFSSTKGQAKELVGEAESSMKLYWHSNEIVP
jgi:hypothetical protein